MKIVNALALLFTIGSVIYCDLLPALLIAPIRTFLIEILGLPVTIGLSIYAAFSVLVVAYAVIHQAN